MTEETKPWMCPSGLHVMGYVKRNGDGVRRMLLLREAIVLREGEKRDIDDIDKEFSSGEMAEVDVMAVVEGYVIDVRCSKCGRTRTWAPGEEAIRRLIEDFREVKNDKR